MNRSLHWLPRLMVGIGLGHIGFGLARKTPLREIADAGVVDSIDGYAEREAAFWFLVSGAFLFALGDIVRTTARETGRVPARLGGWLIGIGAAGVVFMPASGFWLIAALGGLAVTAGRSRHRASGARRRAHR